MKIALLIALLPLPALADATVLEIAAGPDSIAVTAGQIASVTVTGPALPAISVVLTPEMRAPVETLTRAHVGEELILSVCGEDLIRPILRDPITSAEFMLSVAEAAEAKRIAALLASSDCLR